MAAPTKSKSLSVWERLESLEPHSKKEKEILSNPKQNFDKNSNKKFDNLNPRHSNRKINAILTRKQTNNKLHNKNNSKRNRRIHCEDNVKVIKVKERIGFSLRNSNEENKDTIKRSTNRNSIIKSYDKKGHNRSSIKRNRRIDFRMDNPKKKTNNSNRRKFKKKRLSNNHRSNESVSRKLEIRFSQKKNESNCSKTVSTISSSKNRDSEKKCAEIGSEDQNTGHHSRNNAKDLHTNSSNKVTSERRPKEKLKKGSHHEKKNSRKSSTRKFSYQKCSTEILDSKTNENSSKNNKRFDKKHLASSSSAEKCLEERENSSYKHSDTKKLSLFENGSKLFYVLDSLDEKNSNPKIRNERNYRKRINSSVSSSPKSLSKSLERNPKRLKNSSSISRSPISPRKSSERIPKRLRNHSPLSRSPISPRISSERIPKRLRNHSPLSRSSISPRKFIERSPRRIRNISPYSRSLLSPRKSQERIPRRFKNLSPLSRRSPMSPRNVFERSPRRIRNTSPFSKSPISPRRSLERIPRLFQNNSPLSRSSVSPRKMYSSFSLRKNRSPSPYYKSYRKRSTSPDFYQNKIPYDSSERNEKERREATYNMHLNFIYSQLSDHDNAPKKEIELEIGKSTSTGINNEGYINHLNSILNQMSSKNINTGTGTSQDRNFITGTSNIAVPEDDSRANNYKYPNRDEHLPFSFKNSTESYFSNYEDPMQMWRMKR